MLPLEKSKPSYELSEKVVGIYGQAGIGKSTLASMFPGVIFAATEAGLSHLEVAAVYITSWSAPLVKSESGVITGGFMDFCREMVTTKHPYKTICVDTYDNLCRLATEHVCKDLGIDDIGDYKKFGAYHIVTQLLFETMRKLSQSPYGLILTSHIKKQEESSKTMTWEKSTVSIGGKNLSVMVDLCDLLLFMDSEMEGDKEVGVIRTKPSIYWDAKDKNKVLPESIRYPLSSPEVAYKVIEEAFNKGEAS